MNKQISRFIYGITSLGLISTAAFGKADQSTKQQHNNPIAYLYQPQTAEEEGTDDNFVELPGVDTTSLLTQSLNEVEAPTIDLSVDHSDNGGRVLLAIKPIYPRKEHLEGREGWVELLVNVDEHGQVISAEVTDAKPVSRAFSKAAIDSINKWQFKPMTVAGQQVPYQLSQTIEFKLINYINVNGEYVAER